MEGNIIDHGHFELLKSERGRSLLVLNQVNTYLWSSKKNIEYLSLTEGMNEKSGDRHFKILNRGTYFIISPFNNTIFNNIPHLYLEHNNHYDEFVLQNGMPNIIDGYKEIIRTNRLIAGSEIADFTYQKY